MSNIGLIFLKGIKQLRLEGSALSDFVEVEAPHIEPDP